MSQQQSDYRRERMKVDQEYAEKQRAKNRAAVKKNHARRMAEDPEFREQHRAYMRAYFARRRAEDPEFAARRKASNNRSHAGHVARLAASLPGEVWKPARGVRGYFISSEGRVWSNRGMRLVRVRPARRRADGRVVYPTFRY